MPARSSKSARKQSPVVAAVNHIQRFGGSLNLNLHFHAIVADGVFAADDAGRICFRALEPSRVMLERVVRRVRNRSLRWLRRKGFLDKRPPEDRSNEDAERSAIEACADIALQGGGFAALDHAIALDADDGQARFEPRRWGPFTAALDGFNVQAAVRIEAGDDCAAAALPAGPLLDAREVPQGWAGQRPARHPPR